MSDISINFTDTVKRLDAQRLNNTILDAADSVIKPSKPTLEPHFDSKEDKIIPPAIIFSRMMDKMQEYAQSTAEPAELRHAQVGKNINKISEDITKVQDQLIDTKKDIETWESRSRLASYVLNGVTAMTGVGLVMAGDAWTGGSLIVSGVGGTASGLMSSYGWNPTFTGAVALVSGLVGIVGGVGSGARQLYNYGPRALLNTLTHPTFEKSLELAGSLASFISTTVYGYSNIKKNENLSTLSQFDAMHTMKTTERQLLEPKLTSAATSHQGTAKSMSKACSQIVKAQNRFTRDAMRVLTADFPA